MVPELRFTPLERLGRLRLERRPELGHLGEAQPPKKRKEEEEEEEEVRRKERKKKEKKWFGAQWKHGWGLNERCVITDPTTGGGGG